MRRDSAEFGVWMGIRNRCLNPSCSGYYKYGGRGITIADEWREDFGAFLAYVGRRPSPTHQLDRFPNNHGHYEPGNVRWATPTENGRNKRNNVLITIDGITKCASAWDEHCAFNRDGKVVLNRYKRGWRGTKLLAPIGAVPRAPRKQSAGERAKRRKILRRLHAQGVFANSGKKVSQTKRRQFANGTAYNKRDERGCFVSAD